MLYRRGRIWWFKFRVAGRVYRETTSTQSKTLAATVERKRRREVEEGINGVTRRRVPALFKVASSAWLESKRPRLAPKSHQIEKTNLSHLLPIFGRMLITDIQAEDIARYQQHRLDEGASPKTVNLEVGTVRGLLRKHRLWADIQPDVAMLTVLDNVGLALSADDEKKLLKACGDSRSRSLLPALTLALNTGMRYSEIRLLQCWQVDLIARRVKVGVSKTEAGTGRSIPLNDRATAVLKFWLSAFPDRTREDFLFPSERYGVAGNDRVPCVYNTDTSSPIKSWKEAWESAKRKAGVRCRFHDLRHTCTTRMLERGVPLAVVASVLGWSTATTVRMVKRYGHIGNVAQRQAVAVLDRVAIEGDGAQKEAQSEDERAEWTAN